MRFLIDENIRRDLASWLKSQGHDVLCGARSVSDKTLVQRAQKDKRALLTCDTDFSVTLRFPPREYSGILILRIHPPKLESYQKALTSFFKKRKAASIKGKTFLIGEQSFIEIS